MYKILLADDEGIVIDALKFIIDNNCPGMCEIKSAKTGRSVIELAETFRPDIALMDIQMPGINGIEAMKEIRRENLGIIFIVISAYDKFDYAKEAIHLGVLEYVNKPIEQTHMIELLRKAMKMVDKDREKRTTDLMVREKLEIVVPMIENGFIYSILFQGAGKEDIDNYKSLLGMEVDSGFIMVLECGEEGQNGHFTNSVGAGVRVANGYQDARSIVKDFFPKSAMGNVMANKIMLFIPNKLQQDREYENRINCIEQCRKMVRMLRKQMDVYFRIGIGLTRPLEEIEESYSQAVRSLKYAQGSVVHVSDLPIQTGYEDNYPIDIEKRLFENVESGNAESACMEARSYFDWMIQTYSDSDTDIRLKTLEFVLWAEKIAYESGGMMYRFTSRHDYLKTIDTLESMDEIRKWFIGKIEEACRNIEGKKQESSIGIIEKAKSYMKENYQRDLSLDEVSKIVNISPYYFSKLFKEEEKINFIDYLTEIRMENAKRMLQTENKSMKEICIAVGYGDPNYFSRTFKKNVGVTPTEYREGKI